MKIYLQESATSTFWCRVLPSPSKLLGMMHAPSEPRPFAPRKLSDWALLVCLGFFVCCVFLVCFVFNIYTFRAAPEHVKWFSSLLTRCKFKACQHTRGFIICTRVSYQGPWKSLLRSWVWFCMRGRVGISKGCLIMPAFPIQLVCFLLVFKAFKMAFDLWLGLLHVFLVGKFILQYWLDFCVLPQWPLKKEVRESFLAQDVSVAVALW